MKIIQTRELERLVRQTFPQKGFFSARAELDGSIPWHERPLSGGRASAG
jgi:hypothetical protein